MRQKGQSQLICQRQVLGQSGQHQEVNSAGFEFAARRSRRLSNLMLKTQVSRWPMQAVRGIKSQRSGRDFEALGQPLGAQAAGKRAQCQRLQTRAQRQTYTAQREICHSALQLTALDVCPQPYRATALLQVGPEVSKLSQQPQVNAVCSAVQLPLPIAPAPCLQGQQGLHKAPGQAEALA